MMERFSRTERAVIAAMVVLAVAAGWFTWINFKRAFPEAHLEFQVNRESSRPVAEAFTAQHVARAGELVAEAHHAAVFRIDNEAKVFLERELGLEALGELINSREVRLWSWSHRYFRPLQKEELKVEVSPEGEVVGFSHLHPEEAEGASLEEEEARAVAHRLLHEAFGLVPDSLVFIESHREDRPNRRDWSFTFERPDWQAGDATYRMLVEVHGDEPAVFQEYLKVPDAWRQSYQRLRSANETAGLVAAFGMVITLLAAVVILVREGKRENVHWRLVLGFAGVSFLLVFMLSLNNLPLAAYGFDTTGTFGAFLAQQVLGGMAGAGLQALLVLVVVAAGEPLYRARFPNHQRIAAIFGRAGWRSRKTAFGLILGYCLAPIFIAYQVGFYLVSSRFGAWNPAEIPFDNLLNTWFPWVAVLFMGFYPAVSEEFMSRVFSIPLVEKLTRSRVAAIVIPAVIWGFGHAGYPAQPFYIRGVEVAIAGLVVGILLYRFGIIPCLVWHYVVDAGYTSILLVRSGNPYFVVTAIAGTGILLVPLAVAVIGAWRRGGFAVDESMLNAADPAPPEPPPTEAPPVVTLIAPPVGRIAAVAAGLLVAGGLLVWRVQDPGQDVGVSWRPAQIREVAVGFLSERGVDVDEWRLVVTARSDYLGSSSRRYLLEQGGVPLVARFVSELPQWQVRAYRPEEREEWRLAVDDRSGQVVRFWHELREEAEGASLSVDEARVLAEATLAEAGFEMDTLVFKEGKSEKRPARTDHELTWKDPRRSVSEAEYLVTVTVQGDEVDGHQRRLKLPEAWERERERGTLTNYLLLAIKVGALAWLVVHGLFTFYRGIRSGAIPWTQVLMIAGGLVLLLALGAILSAPLAWDQYPAAWPAATFRTALVVGLAIAVLAQAALVVLALGAVTACYPYSRGVTAPAARRPVALAAVLGAAAVIGASYLLDGMTGWGLSVFPRLFPDAPVSLPPSFATVVPVLALVGPALLGGLVMLALVALALHLFAHTGNRLLAALMAVLAVIALVPGGADASLGEFLTGVGRAAVTLALAAVLVKWVLGANPVAYVLAAAWLGIVQVVVALVAQPGATYAAQGWALAVVAVLVSLAWLTRRGQQLMG